MILICIIVASLCLTSCAQKSTERDSVIIEVYEVEKANGTFAAGKLRYMEEYAEENDRPKSKTVYNPDQSMRGKEVYKYKDNAKYPYSSVYYGPDDKPLSTYEFTYLDSLKASSIAFEGESDVVLRKEAFQYDTKGNMVRKVIYNELNQKERTFMFGHDEYGNETTMVVLDKDDNELFRETYELTTIDSKKRWIAKYGYKDKDKMPMTFYKRSMND